MKIGQDTAEQVWFNIHTRHGSCEVALDPSSRGFRQMYRKLAAPYARYQRKHDGAFPEGVEDEIARKCAAHAVLMDWRGMEDEDGEPLEYSPENAIRAFEDPAIGDQLLKGVMDAATDLWDATAQEVEDVAKN